MGKNSKKTNYLHLETFFFPFFEKKITREEFHED